MKEHFWIFRSFWENTERQRGPQAPGFHVCYNCGITATETNQDAVCPPWGASSNEKKSDSIKNPYSAGETDTLVLVLKHLEIIEPVLIRAGYSTEARMAQNCRDWLERLIQKKELADAKKA